MGRSLNSSETRHIFWIAVLFLIVLFFVRVFLLFPYVAQPLNVYDVVEKFVGDLFASVIVAGFLALAIPILFPVERSVEEVKREGATDYFEKAFSTTGRWDFSGSSGTFTRAVTLPTLDALTRKVEKHVDVLVLINDPRHDWSCERYSDYKNLSGETPWAVEQVRIELLATVISCACYHLGNLRMPIRLGLKRSLSRYRYDVATPYAIVTRETPGEAALVIYSQSVRYQGILEEISCQRDQAEMMDLDGLLGAPGINRRITVKTITEEQARSILGHLKLDGVLAACGDGGIAKLMESIKKPKHRYAKR